MIATLLQAGQVPTLATPDIDWTALAPHLILVVGGMLLLTIVSSSRASCPSWFHAVWTIAVAVAAICAMVPLWHRVQDGRGRRPRWPARSGLDGFSLFVTVGDLRLGDPRRAPARRLPPA